MRPGLPVLTVEGLSKRYRRRVILHGVSFSVGAGEAVAIIGPNGAGKSTLLGCISGERLPDSGEIRVCGTNPFSDLGAAARCTGVVAEQPFLYGELTVGEMLEFIVEVRRRHLPHVAQEVIRLLRLLGLEGAEGALCRELSQGMGRKVAIIAGLLHRPSLIVMDEAFNGLDLPSADRLVEELAERRRNGAAVLMSSHDLHLLARICGRGLLVAGGAEVTPLSGAEWERWRSAPSLGLNVAGARGSHQPDQQNS
ncbi:MAG: ATP-binding cassette domain-containing protein [Gemmatimonadetes bacterium]|nr:ATP-binding cassette domain-containing protein [Gemmatimonadota bacterium]